MIMKMKAVPAEGVASARLGEAVSISCSVQVFFDHHDGDGDGDKVDGYGDGDEGHL